MPLNDERMQLNRNIQNDCVLKQIYTLYLHISTRGAKGRKHKMIGSVDSVTIMLVR